MRATVAQVAIGLLRQHLRPGEQVHGIVTLGGDAPNIVPARAEGDWMVRAPTVADLDLVRPRIERCFEAGALATGATLAIEDLAPVYTHMEHDPDLLDLYRENVDPWNFESSDYEREKYQATLRALPRPRYERACELGCSIGVFTHLLASRCGEVLAVDVSAEALERARERCRDDRNVRFERMDLTTEYPAGTFDLTIVSEIGYYFSQADLEQLCTRVAEHSAPGASIVLVHYTPPAPEHALEARVVHEVFRREPLLRHSAGFERTTYRLDLFERLSISKTECAETGSRA